MSGEFVAVVFHLFSIRVETESDGTRWRTAGEVKGKEANGVGSQQSGTVSEHVLSSITTADAHTSAASSRLNWHTRRYKWTRPFRWKTKSGFCACAITIRFHSTFSHKCFRISAFTHTHTQKTQSYENFTRRGGCTASWPVTIPLSLCLAT